MSETRSEQYFGPKIAVVYYSSTGGTYAIANAEAEGAEKAGATVRVVRAAELAPAHAIASNEDWAAHASVTGDVPVATHQDLLWADAVIVGSPTRFIVPPGYTAEVEFEQGNPYGASFVASSEVNRRRQSRLVATVAAATGSLRAA